MLNQKVYLVLSLKEAREIVRAAQRHSRKVNFGRLVGCACIVVRSELVGRMPGQIDTVKFMDSVRNAAK